MLSPKDRADWNRCPKCGSLDISAESYEIEFDMFYQQVLCESCHTSWYEVYEASHRENIQTPAEREADAL